VGFSPESNEAQKFRHALVAAGYDEGRDLLIEWRFASGDYNKVAALATELVQRR
jgi:putative ABC transport system substrate-binding protein